ncbi:hypothetical protein Cgig2_026615 [Carnegiea gigantea]|uniref:Uncharacterized protein n=1 Tax=Carnegiea gigantea TaxID=171969 RepID=A0A9Q1GKX8_9CARY|nr:hypothetical protein Cgig2_026615 [Carnegiea gigantea]
MGNTDSELVLDINGNPLEVGLEYSIEPTIGIFGGIERGDPLKFVPVHETQKEIHLSSDVHIDSDKNAYCRDEGLWRLGYDASNSRIMVIASNIFNQPRASFKIKKSTDSFIHSYKITTSSVEPPLGQEEFYYLTVFLDSLLMRSNSQAWAYLHL